MKINSCLVFALLLLVLLISYSFAVETSQKATDKVEPEATEKVEPAGNGGGNWGGGGGGGGHWGGGGGGGCRHGCCYHGRYGCQQCCQSPEEAKAFAEKQDKVKPAGGGGNWGGGGGGNWGGGGGGGNWGGGGHGGGCRHGCCYHGRYGCQQCCSSPEEAKAFMEKQAAHP